MNTIDAAQSTQISITPQLSTDTYLRQATPVSRPFIIYGGTDITGTAEGNDSVESYCNLDYTSASRYRLDREDHNQIFQFFLTEGGNTRFAFCLDKFADGPYNDVPYQSAPFETIFPNLTERQKQMLAWTIANNFPTISASDTFALAGVDPTAVPPLDDNDAYAVVQVTLWVLLGQISVDEVNFLDCTTGATHPKSARMRAAVLRLLELAGNYADTATSQIPSIPVGSSTSSCPKQEYLYCCNKGMIPSNPSIPYIVFKGCPDEIRCVCGRLLIGPFKLQSTFTGQSTITIEPLCMCDEGFTASFMDFCGNPISTPSVNQEFYIAVKVVNKFMCFNVNASITGLITRVLTMEPTNAPNYQPIGGTLASIDVTTNTTICICVINPYDNSCTSSRLTESNISILNNNNNSNSNNNNNSNSSSSSNSSASCMPMCWSGWYWGDPWNPRPSYPLEPQYPPYPPYPPRPPYPACPPGMACQPYPPESACPPGMTCQPYPAKPPCPGPPYPPEPPCQSGPPKPPCQCQPCQPESQCQCQPCPPKPPCQCQPYPPEPSCQCQPCPPKLPCPPEPPCCPPIC